MLKLKTLYANTLLIALIAIFLTFYLFVSATLAEDYKLQRDSAIVDMVSMGYTPIEAACALRDDSLFIKQVCTRL